MQDEDIMAIQSAVKVQMRKYLSGVSLFDIASFDWLQKLLSSVLKAVAEAIVESWQETLLKLSKELTLECPSCGRKRAWKWRRGRKLKVSLVGLNVELPQPLVECDHCETKALNVMKILTGLSSGDSSTELELLIARRGVQDTYGRASREMKAHHGQDIERTKIRRKGLVIEQEAVEFAEQRRTRMETTSLPAKGPEKLLIEADGGSVRTGIMAPCEDGDPGYGKKTEKRGLPRRKKNIHNREMITMDIRAPGEMEPRALDVMVPVLSPPGERSRLMTTMAARAGAADNTTMRGLGDMGSGLARAFEGAFPDNKSYWAADWKHITDYVANACKVLTDFDITSWIEQMHDALWQRHKSMSDYLLSQAFGHLKLPMPEGTEKCPLHALQRKTGGQDLTHNTYTIRKMMKYILQRLVSEALSDRVLRLALVEHIALRRQMVACSRQTILCTETFAPSTELRSSSLARSPVISAVNGLHGQYRGQPDLHPVL